MITCIPSVPQAVMATSNAKGARLLPRIGGVVRRDIRRSEIPRHCALGVCARQHRRCQVGMSLRPLDGGRGSERARASAHRARLLQSVINAAGPGSVLQPRSIGSQYCLGLWPPAAAFNRSGRGLMTAAPGRSAAPFNRCGRRLASFGHRRRQINHCKTRLTASGPAVFADHVQCRVSDAACSREISINICCWTAVMTSASVEKTPMSRISSQ